MKEKNNQDKKNNISTNNMNQPDCSRLRIIYTVAFAGLFLTELLIALFVRDSFIRPYVGDMLVVILLYCAARIIEPQKLRNLPLWIFIFAAFVETLQYFRIDKVFGLDGIRAVQIILGATFDWKDILCYAVGCLVVFGVQEGAHKFQRK